MNTYSKSGFLKNSLLLIFILSSFLSLAQTENACGKARKIVKLIQEHHFSIGEIDEKYTVKVCDLFIKGLDPEENIFSLNEVEKIKSLSPLFTKELTESGCEFFTQTSKIFTERLQVKDEILAKLVDYQWKQNIGEGSLSLQPKNEYVSSADFSDRVKNQINAQLLVETLLAQDENSTFDEMAFQAKGQESIRRERCKYERWRTNEAATIKLVSDVYFQAVSNAFDPHTIYVSEDIRGDFMAQLQAQTLAFGLEVDLNASGEIEIIGLIPGSSAWNCNQLNEGDVLLSVKNRKGKSKDFSCAEAQEAADLITDMLVFDAKFTIKKKSGKTITVDLYKSTQVPTENIVQSFILEGEKKIGYIYLPSFYSSAMDGRGCGDAVAKQLIKLKREGIEALIFDVRENGGGAFDEALKISGMFIDYGAVSMTDTREEDPKIYKDPARGKLFSAPLIVLQNRLSGSASELFAATMQDYNRALIVGSPSFGKSTMQQHLPLSSWEKSRGRRTINKAGYVKTTIGKFYRVTGESHQKKGVQPDVLLPESDIYQHFGESTYEHALPNDQLDKDSYFKPLTKIPQAEIIANSQKRVAQSSAFQQLVEDNNLLQELKGKPFTISLTSLSPLVKVMQTAGDYKEEKESPFSAKIPTYLQSFVKETEATKTMKAFMTESLEKNVYVREAYQIGLDLLKNQ